MTQATTLKGLTLEIYRDDYNCKLNKFYDKKAVTLIGSNMPELFESSESKPAIKFITRNLFGKEYTHAEPMEPGNYAFGGSFVFTSDSRLRDLYPYPIPLHDRQMNLEVNVMRPNYSYLQKEPTVSATGTSYHNSTITASPEDLRKVLGEPTYEQNDGSDKTNIEWERQTISGHIFTVYDWKEYRPISETEPIEWHIGGKCSADTEQAKAEIKSALNALK